MSLNHLRLYFSFKRKEISVIRRTAYYRALSSSLPIILPKLLILLVFTTHIFTGNRFTAPEVNPYYKFTNNLNTIQQAFREKRNQKSWKPLCGDIPYDID